MQAPVWRRPTWRAGSSSATRRGAHRHPPERRRRLISVVLPAPTNADNFRYAEAALAAPRAQGVTTFMDAAADANMLRAYATLAEQRKLTAAPTSVGPMHGTSRDGGVGRARRGG
ncbi:hypothetical protein [Streptomyces graminofaciens]|nr:hypothetical protein [Streptomyces graminofaciens]